MRIALNLIALRPESQAGVERFARSLLGSLRLSEQIKLIIHTRSEVSPEIILGKEFIQNHTATFLSRWKCNSTFSRLFIEMVWLSFRTYFFDTVFSINNFGPIFGKKEQTRVVVIHDVWFLDDEFNGQHLKKYLFALLIKLQLNSTARVVTVSEFSRKAISEKLKVSTNKITVIPNCLPPDPELQIDKSYSEELESKLVNKTKKFFLMVGSDRPNKNIFLAVKAYVIYAQSCSNPLALRVVGTFSESFKSKLLSVIPDDLAMDFLVAGYVDDNDYRVLLRNSVGLIFPSLYEGFGIPVIEAMNVGKRVLISKGTVCEEIAGDCGVVVDGTNERSISRGLKNLGTDFEGKFSATCISRSDCFKNCGELGKLLQDLLENT